MPVVSESLVASLTQCLLFINKALAPMAIMHKVGGVLCPGVLFVRYTEELEEPRY